MNEPYNFTVILDDVGAHGWNPEHEDIIFYAYQAGRRLIYLSGSLINVTSGCTLAAIGISASRTTNLSMFQITLNNNSYLATGADEVYNVIIYHYYGGIILNYYIASGSTLNGIKNLTLDQYAFYSVG